MPTRTSSRRYENRLDEPSADFGPQQVITTQTNAALEVKIRDLDGDGGGDVISGESTGGQLAWYENRLNEPSTDFGPKQLIASGQVGTFAVADMDGDGDADLLSPVGFNLITWSENRLGEPSADFANQVLTTTGGVVSAVEAVDLDGNFGFDLVQGAYQDGTIVWHAQRSTDPLDPDSDDDGLLDGFELEFGMDPLAPGETFGNPDGDGLTNLEEQELGSDPLVADSDGDGLKDGAEREIGTDPRNADTDGDGLGDGDEVLTWSFAAPITITTATDSVWDLFAADLDGDGDADLLSVSALDDKVAWYENRLDEPAADFGSQQVLSTLDVARGVSAFDLDGDGDLDVVAGSESTTVWYENRLDEPSADFGPPLEITTPALPCWSFAFEDFDGDGDSDLVCGDGAKVVTLDNRLDEPSADFGSPVVLGAEGNWVRTVSLVDLDQDLDDDILVGGYQGTTAWYENRLNEPSADFGPRQGLGSGVQEYAALPADLDNDGDQDVVYLKDGLTSTAAILWLENRLNEGMGFAGATTLKSLAGTLLGAELDVRDFDLDGDPDLLVSSLTGATLWYENGAAWAAVGLPGGAATQGAGATLTADFTGDGAADLVLGLSGADSIVWLRRLNLDPHDPDTDGDGLLDGFEFDNGFDGLTPGEETGDPDLDGLTNLAEQTAGTNPNDADSDDDGFSDGVEVAAGSDPLDTPPVAVPALSTWGTALLAGLLASLGAAVARRQKGS